MDTIHMACPITSYVWQFSDTQSYAPTPQRVFGDDGQLHSSACGSPMRFKRCRRSARRSQGELSFSGARELTRVATGETEGEWLQAQRERARAPYPSRTSAKILPMRCP